MPIDLAVPMGPSTPTPLVERTTLVFLGKVLVLLLATGLWLGVQCAYLGSLPSEAQETIAGP